MTATPIPRTVAMTVFGDMETSTLRELPAGRSPIQTHVVETSKPAWVERTWQRIAEEVGKGHQAYVVCPKIGDPADPSAADDVEVEPPPDDDGASGAAGEVASRELTGVYDMAERLRAVPSLTGLRIEVLHGRLDPDVKDRTMRAFAAGEIDVLVSTTVIEVGVDVANASVMVVMDADRFGISQLHQLRGRIGRGEHSSTCLLAGPPGSPRLRALAKHSDGFKLAEIDLRLRKEGELVGTRQSGLGQFKFASLPEDADLLERARARAREILAREPELDGPMHALLGGALEDAFGADALRPIPA
jgi:ATP-dependent DNA helicase RecG